MGVFKRVLADSLDLGLLVLVVLFLYGLFYAFGSVLSSVQSSYILTILSSPDPLLAIRPALASALSSLSDPLTLLSMLLYGILLTYLSLVVIGWIGKRRTGYPENPFKRAVSVIVPFIILGIIVFSPVALLLTLMLYFSSNTVVLIVLFVLFTIFLLIYTPIVAPSMVSLVLDADSVSKALRNGVLVGRRRWIWIILYTIGVAVITSILLAIFGYLAALFPAAADPLLVLYQSFSFILPLAVLTEVYVEDAFGE